ncbi:MAG: AraC family transcriptional regulator [Sandaracinaceae bacterium]|nr:AraC family transcriptional regulator [Sandaracinaceae bacterium]
MERAGAAHDAGAAHVSAADTAHRPRVERAIRFIAEHLDEPITLADVARVAHLSEHHFHRVFAAVTGEPIGRFITRRRLELAALRLAYEPARSVTEIGLSVGYSSPSNFAKAFSAHFGCTPSHVRAPGAALPAALGRLATRYGRSFDPLALHALPPDAPPARVREELARLRASLRFETRDAPLPLACLASPDGYDTDAIGETIARLVEHALARGLSDEAVDVWGIGYDSPVLTAPELRRYHAAVPCPAGSELPAPFFPGAVGPGRFAVFDYDGPVDGVEARWLSVYSTWLPASGLRAGAHVALDRYVGDWPEDGRVRMELWLAVE